MRVERIGVEVGREPLRVFSGGMKRKTPAVNWDEMTLMHRLEADEWLTSAICANGCKGRPPAEEEHGIRLRRYRG